MKYFILVLLSLCSAGCMTANPFQQYYTDMSGGMDVRKHPGMEVPPVTPILLRGTTKEEDLQRMLEDGFRLMGYSFFNTGEMNQSQAVEMGRKLGATVVLLYSQYTHTATGTTDIVTPEVTTINTNASGNGTYSGTGSYSGGAYVGNTFGNYSGTMSNSGVASVKANAQTTVTQYHRTAVPYSIQRYDYLANFWAKAKPAIFGVVPIDLTPEMRKTIGTNKGFLVRAVIKGSPAFYADIFKGDIITQFNDEGIFGPVDFSQKLEALVGQKIIVHIMRDGNLLTKEVQLSN